MIPKLINKFKELEERTLMKIKNKLFNMNK